jgi:hypothetical protein
MRKKTTTSQRIRSLIDSGYNNKAIIEKIKCKPQAVYNIRYQINKARGLGSIGELPNPTNGIGAPPKRTRKIRAGELASLPPSKPAINPAQNAWPYDAPALQGAEPYMPITMVEPTLWQRIKGWFRG